MSPIFKKASLALVVGSFITGVTAAPGFAAPKVVTTIPPIHSLVAGVMQGVGEPIVLITGGASPHTFALKPSQARALQQADAIFWIGDELESFLTKPLAALSTKSTAVQLSTVHGVRLLDTREGGAWEAHDDHGHDDHAKHDEHDHDKHDDHAKHDDHDHDKDHGHAKHDDHDHGKDHDKHDDHAHGEKDLHIWLDPDVAKHMVEAIAAKLSTVDPGNATTYAANAKKLEKRLDDLETSIKARVAPVKDRPYLVFHDAYHYFEDRFGTKAVGSITVAAERKPGAKRLSELREKIEHEGAVCVFAEPQFQPAIVRSLVDGTKARAGVLDPVGGDIAPGPNAYFQLMENMADSLVSCLSTSS